MGQAQTTDSTSKGSYGQYIAQNVQGSSLTHNRTGSSGNVNKGYEFVNNQPTNPNQNQMQPNQNQPNQNQIQNQKRYKAVFTINDLLDAFKTYAIEGKYLNNTRFNDTIEKLFSRIDIPSMHYTYLSEKIYTLLDESKDGKINEEEYINGMKNVLTNREVRLKLSMMAMMSRPEERNYLDFNEIVEFLFKSWVYGYKHLGWQIKRDKSKINIIIQIR